MGHTPQSLLHSGGCLPQNSSNVSQPGWPSLLQFPVWYHPGQLIFPVWYHPGQLNFSVWYHPARGLVFFASFFLQIILLSAWFLG